MISSATSRSFTTVVTTTTADTNWLTPAQNAPESADSGLPGLSCDCCCSTKLAGVAADRMSTVNWKTAKVRRTISIRLSILSAYGLTSMTLTMEHMRMSSTNPGIYTLLVSKLVTTTTSSSFRVFCTSIVHHHTSRRYHVHRKP